MNRESFAAARAVARRLNLRHLRAHRLRTLLTVAGIGAGVALAFSIAVINSTLLSSFRDSMLELAGRAEIEVAAPDSTGLQETAVSAVERVPGVELAVPVLRSTTTVGGEEGVLVLGVTPEFTELFPPGLGPLARVELEGGFGSQGRGLVLARGVAGEIGVSIGGNTSVVTPRGGAPAEITGLIGGGAVGGLNGGRIALMTLEASQEMFERALKREPEAAHIHYGLAATRARLGSIDLALESLQRALDLQPNLRVRAQHDHDLNPLRNDPDFDRLIFSNPS